MVQPSFQTAEGSAARAIGRRRQQRNGPDDRGHQHTHRLANASQAVPNWDVSSRWPCREEIGLFTGVGQAQMAAAAEIAATALFSQRRSISFYCQWPYAIGRPAGGRSSLAVRAGRYSAPANCGRRRHSAGRAGMGAKHFGARVTRFEDPALLAGRGRFVDDIPLPGALHACFVRSPHGHAKIRSIDAQAALAHAGRPRGAHRRRPAGADAHRAHPEADAPIPTIRTHAHPALRSRATRSATSARRSPW